MTLSAREIRLAMFTLFAVIVGMTWFLGEDKLNEYGELVDRADDADLMISKLESRVARRDGYLRRIETIKLVLPEFPIGRDVKSQMLQQLNGWAGRHRMGISSVNPDKEKEIGDLGLYRLSVNVAWSGNLEQLTRFLFDMQMQGAVIDVRQLTVKADNKGDLSGNMRVDFAYNRVDPSTIPPAPAPAPTPAPAPPGLTVTPVPTTPPSATPEEAGPEASVPAPTPPVENPGARATPAAPVAPPGMPVPAPAAPKLSPPSAPPSLPVPGAPPSPPTPPPAPGSGQPPAVDTPS